MEQLHTCSISNNISQSYDASSQTCSLGRLDLSNGDSGTEISLMVGLQSSLDRPGKAAPDEQDHNGRFRRLRIVSPPGREAVRTQEQGRLVAARAVLSHAARWGFSFKRYKTMFSQALFHRSLHHPPLAGRPKQALPRFLLRLLA